jgi:alanyl-tRNA synthetase
MALFGEKYGDKVRVVTMGPVSKELCGGTHASSTGQIGLFHITSESSISAGVRRIEAITGMNSLKAFHENKAIVEQLSGMFKVSAAAVVQKAEALLDINKQLETAVADLSQQQAAGQIAGILDEARKSSGKVLFAVKSLGKISKDSFSLFCDGISDKLRTPDFLNGVIMLGAIVDNKAQLFAAAGQTAIKAGVNSGALIKEAAQKAGGSGGGNPARAQAGCKNPDKLDEALQTAKLSIAKLAGV